MSLSTPLLLLSLAAGHVGAGDIAWQPSFEDALDAAAKDGRVVFVAVNMDGERANDRMLAKVYTDKRVCKLAESTVNLIASNDVHAKGDKTCKRFGGMTCTDHRLVDAWVREEVLAPDPDGFVVAPQHVFLDSRGGVLLSVPYEISAPELEWCFVTALRTTDPDFDTKMSTAARAPRRLILGGVYDSGKAGDAAPITREEALALIEEIKKGMQGEERNRATRRLATADEPEAREFILSILRSSGGRGGGRGGGGGGRGGDTRGKLLRWIGVASPTSYWEVCEVFLSGEESMRIEAVVALEQLAAPESLREILARLKKEKNPAIQKNLLRAVGTTGLDDKRARSTLLKQATDPKEKNELLRLNAIVALGSLAPSPEVVELLEETLRGEPGQDRIAAACAIAMTRDKDWVEALEVQLEKAQEPAGAGVASNPWKNALESALRVLKEGRLAPLEPTFKAITRDEIARDRIFRDGVKEEEQEEEAEPPTEEDPPADGG